MQLVFKQLAPYAKLELMIFQNSEAQNLPTITEVAPGVLKLTFGEPSKFTPLSVCNESPRKESLAKLPGGNLPFDVESIKFTKNHRGCIVNVPLNDDEQIYGFGLQMNTFGQRGLKRRPIVNDHPNNNLGFTHAPAPMYVSNLGYAIVVNTARYTTFYCGTHKTTKDKHMEPMNEDKFSIDELYDYSDTDASRVIVDIPHAKGIEVFVFVGDNMKTAVQRYNLFSGGGAMPPIWGMGIKYRVKKDSKYADVIKTARYFREKDIPCDVLGLEPKWQTAAYSCSYIWNPETFPKPQLLIDTLKTMNFKLNLWEHAFVHPTSPIYRNLLDKSGDYTVWNGLVPDFFDPKARKIYNDYHDNTFVKKGISGFKLDECDNSDLSKGDWIWSFPELSQFPSGMDGEQMHQLFGLLYANSINRIFRKNNRRTYLDYRSSNAFASSIPASLYSDTYNHDEYIHMIVNAGFSGLLWSPEVRESSSKTELLRRIQTAVLSAQALINSWYLKNPPWLQYDKDKNNNDIFLKNANELEELVRKQFNFRMSLVPYLYTAFAKYHFDGTPPFRALVLDYSDDKNLESIYNEYMIGESILAAPLTGESDTREVYFPEGNWYNFNTNRKYVGRNSYIIKTTLSQIPIFIKEGTILPLAIPKEFTDDQQNYKIICKVYGDRPSSASLFEDDGISFDFEKKEFNWIKLKWDGKRGTAESNRNYKGKLYTIINWEKVM